MRRRRLASSLAIYFATKVFPPNLLFGAYVTRRGATTPARTTMRLRETLLLCAFLVACVAATARASFALYNTREEVEALTAAIWKVKEVFGR